MSISPTRLHGVPPLPNEILYHIMTYAVTECLHRYWGSPWSHAANGTKPDLTLDHIRNLLRTYLIRDVTRQVLSDILKITVTGRDRCVVVLYKSSLIHISCSSFLLPQDTWGYIRHVLDATSKAWTTLQEPSIWSGPLSDGSLGSLYVSYALCVRSGAAGKPSHQLDKMYGTLQIKLSAVHPRLLTDAIEPSLKDFAQSIQESE